MPPRNIQFANGEIFHVVTRAVDGIKLFRSNGDYSRMIHDLHEFNDEEFYASKYRVAAHRNNGSIDVTLPGNVTSMQGGKPRELLVEILCFCLMPNHTHLLLRQLKVDGISKFMKKFGGYSYYFNLKYGRTGHLFQDRFKAVHINDDRQLLTAFVYIHTNPVALIYPGWKDKGIVDAEKAARYTESYKWSSYSDYLGVGNFPSVTSREFLQEFMGGVDSCKDAVNSWLTHKKELVDFDYVAIE